MNIGITDLIQEHGRCDRLSIAQLSGQIWHTLQIQRPGVTTNKAQKQQFAVFPEVMAWVVQVGRQHREYWRGFKTA